MSVAHPPAIDTSYLERLREELQDDDPDSGDAIAELMGLFVKNSARLEAEFNEALDLGDLDALADSAHQLVSASAWIGALRLSGIARLVEDEARRGVFASAQTAVAAAVEEISRVRQALERLEAAPR
ncbi:MAG: Hpt domain-containing protein [Myxococcales bacterium]|nr:Hpt domain-containing protein [Myxococcales bacterium]MCB9735805.1 Hpt domain-containing protein [Deltaproteobacteria bacterium]